jgi:predicted  nucleic acid-binding Zn-ribbon protein
MQKSFPNYSLEINELLQRIDRDLANAAKPICPATATVPDSGAAALAGVSALASSIAGLRTIITEVTNLVLKIQKNSSKNSEENSSQSAKNDDTPNEDDGLEEDPYANLSVILNSTGKYTLLIKSNIAEDQLVISATKKGFKSITYKITTNEIGNASIITSRKLAGFTLTVRYGGEFFIVKNL